MTAALAAEAAVIEAGVYDGMPHGVYLADPVPGGSLSASGARLLLPPNCPAVFRHRREVGQQQRPEFDIGHAAHKLVLGVGPEIVTIEAKDWKTKKAQEARDAAHAVGKVPLLVADAQRVTAMAAALRDHPVASVLFEPGSGRPEQSLFWPDAEFGIWRRARLDWLPDPRGGRLVLPDYKTTKSADPSALPRAMHSYGYHLQAAWYLDAVTELDLAGEAYPAFVLVFQEREPPYLVTIAEPDREAIRWGRTLARRALEIYRDCTEADRWPDYTAGEVVPLGLPRWAIYDYQDEGYES